MTVEVNRTVGCTTIEVAELYRVVTNALRVDGSMRQVRREAATNNVVY